MTFCVGMVGVTIASMELLRHDRLGRVDGGMRGCRRDVLDREWDHGSKRSPDRNQAMELLGREPLQLWLRRLTLASLLSVEP